LTRFKKFLDQNSVCIPGLLHPSRIPSMPSPLWLLRIYFSDIGLCSFNCNYLKQHKLFRIEGHSTSSGVGDDAEAKWVIASSH